MEEYEREVELIDYIEVLLKRKGLIAAVTVVCALAAGLLTDTSPRQYEGQALVVVSQPIASTGSADGDEAGTPGSEIRVSGLSAQTYQALAKGDQLMQSLLDTLLTMEGTDEEVQEFLREADPSSMAAMLTAELVEETEKADSPLLAFRAASGVESLPVPLVNLWTELFMERHRGLSSNVADSYYQWVEGQYETGRANLQTTEDRLRKLTTAYGELSVVETAIGIKTSRLDSALVDYQNLETELEAKERELAFIRSLLAQIDHGGEWLGYADRSELPSRSAVVRGTALRRQTVVARWDVEESITDSLDLAERHAATRDAHDARQRAQLLQFEGATGINLKRQLASDLNTTLGDYRAEAAILDRQTKALVNELQVLGQNLKREPPVRTVGKAIVDEQLWAQAASRRGMDPRLQDELGKYRLMTESLNPTYQKLSDEFRTSQIAHDRATTQVNFLTTEIPQLEQKLLALQAMVDSLAKLESVLLSQLGREAIAMNDPLQREVQPMNERLARKRRSLAAHREEYISLQGREETLSRQIISLTVQVGFEKGDFESWSEQVRVQGVIADSLARERSDLESELKVYQTTFERFATLLEEARIARQQAAGDIQIVSRAMVSRPVPRGTVKKAAIAGIVGLMASVMLAFLLEYMVRAREGRPGGAPDPG